MSADAGSVGQRMTDGSVGTAAAAGRRSEKKKWQFWQDKAQIKVSRKNT
jgi:hypothetical protein